MLLIRVAKTKVLVTAKLICVFVFAYAECWFSHEVAHVSKCISWVMSLHKRYFDLRLHLY